MDIRHFEEIISLSGLKLNPGKVIDRTIDTHRPILLTSRGRGVAVVQALDDYEKGAEELRFVKAVAQGLMDIQGGDTLSLDKARKLLGIRN